MASAEARAGYAVNHCFAQDFMMPRAVSEKMEPDFTTSDSTDSDMKWWLHVKTNMSDTDFTCQHLNTLESKLDVFNVNIGSDQSVKNFDAALEQQWNVYAKCMKKTNDTRTPKIEAVLNNDMYITHKMKNEDEFWYSDDDVTSFLVSEQYKSVSSDLEPHWLGAEKTRPWWQSTGKDDLASLVAKKPFEYIENCDLLEPNTKPFRKIPNLSQRDIDSEKSLVLPLNQKSEIYTSTTLTSGCSFQDSDKTSSRSSESKDSYSSKNKDSYMNSESTAKAELLKALCRSQTRAREAEKAAQEACDEKEHIVSLFFKQASQLFAYKQWLHVLQLENLCLQLRNKNQPSLNNLFPYDAGKHHRKSRRKTKDRRRGIGECVFAFAIGLALAGAGLLLGWTFGCMFPSF
ncbi:hypothetical protein P8452_00794 [Trifolium repens]|nr:hypothetical protein QL285_000854 [Trifolium repens]WJX10024.1 hypothetical protein P8452_00794 [Trifolium repens]